MTRVADTEPATTARSTLARSSAISFAGSAISALMGLILIIVLGRALGDAGSGVVLQAIASFTIALGIARLGMDSAALWLLPRVVDSEPAAVRPTCWYLLTVAAVGGVLGAAGLLITSHLLDGTAAGTATAQALRSIAPFLPAASVMLTALAATRALGRITTYVVIGNVALPTLRPALVLAVVALGGGAVAAGVAWSVPVLPAAAAAVIVLAVQTRRSAPSLSPKEFLRGPLPGRAARYAAPRVASSGLEQLLIWAAVPMVGALAGTAAAGVYGSAARLVAAGMVIDTALRVVVSPMFSRFLHRGEGAQLEGLHRTATIWLVLFSAPVYLLLATFSPTVLRLLGEAFTAGAPVLTLMSLAALTTFLAGNIHSVLLMSGSSGLAALNKVVAVATNLVLIALLVPLWGITGAAVAWAVACLLDALLATLEVRYVLRLNVTLRPALPPLMLGLLAVGLPAVALRGALGPTVPALMLATTIGGVLMLVACRLWRTTLHLDDLVGIARRRGTGHVPGDAVSGPRERHR